MTVSPSVCVGAPCVVNTKKFGPSPLPTTAARTDPWEARRLANIHKDWEEGGKGRSGRGNVPSTPVSQQSQPPEHPKPSYKTPPRGALPSKGWKVKSLARLSRSHCPPKPLSQSPSHRKA